MFSLFFVLDFLGLGATLKYKQNPLFIKKTFKQIFHKKNKKIKKNFHFRKKAQNLKISYLLQIKKQKKQKKIKIISLLF